MNIKITPGSPYFGERDVVRERFAYALRRSNAVLLFGGRQSGKTSFLRSVLEQSLKQRADVNVLSSYEMFVYVDLTRLRFDATPVDFFQLLIDRVHAACEAQIEGFTHSQKFLPTDLDTFVNALRAIVVACSQVDLRIIFLLDEAKRVLGSRFPRGFQDNLFSLLFGEAGDQIKVAMVFAGNQHLNELLKDDTSPIGSRSLSVYLSNLTMSSIEELTSSLLNSKNMNADANFIASELIEISGGHAGLTARLLERTFSDQTKLEPKIWAPEIAGDSETLFENWILSMSTEARDFVSNFAETRATSIQMLAARLDARGFNKFLTRRVFEEYEYTGIAQRVGDELIAINSLFWNYIKIVAIDEPQSVAKEGVWSLIEETELALRQLVLSRFISKFGNSAYDRMQKILGDKAWDQVNATLEKSKTQYPYARQSSQRDLMSCMYLGQLGALMTNGATWEMFKTSFRDKRELEDKLAYITPVRNDRAHFSLVPEKELDRCRIACDDLLAIAERELDSSRATS